MAWSALAARVGGLAILLPLVLVRFSPMEVSVWLLFAAIANLQVIADFGFGPTFSREIAYGFSGHSLVGVREPSVNSDNIEENSSLPNWTAITSAIVAMRWLYRRIAFVAFFIIGVLGTWAVKIPIERIAEPQMVWLSWCIVALTTTIMIYGNAYISFLIGANRIDLQKRWEALIVGISLVAQLITVVLNMEFFVLVLVAQMGFIVQFFVNRQLAIRVSESRFLNGGQNELNKIVLRSMWPAAWRTAIGAVMSLGVSQGMAITMANVLVAGEAASVQLALRVMQIISSFSQVPFYTRIPALNRLRANNQELPLILMAQSVMRLSFWVYLIGAIAVDLFVRKLLIFVDSQTQFPDQIFWVILVAAVFLERFGAMHIQLLLTSNKAIAHIANGITGLIWVFLMVYIFPIIGYLALPVSMLLSYIAWYVWYSAMHSYRALPNISVWHFESKSSLLPFILIVLWIVYSAIDI